MNRGVIILAILLALAIGARMTPSRGTRNNNPGNIRRTGADWSGMTARQPDPEFVTFSRPEWGFRAMTRILRTYRDHHGIDTVRGIIERWAPAHENPTDAYVRFVAERVGVAPDARIDLDAHLPELLAAMARFETGEEWSDEYIQQGIRLA